MSIKPRRNGFAFLGAMVLGAGGCTFDGHARTMPPLDAGLDWTQIQAHPLRRALPPGTRAGSLFVTSEPEVGARILVNGEFIGRTPCRVVDLAPGDYEVVLLSVTGARQNQTATVESGKEQVVAALLEGGDPDPMITLVERMIGAMYGEEVLSRTAWTRGRFRAVEIEAGMGTSFEDATIEVISSAREIRSRFQCKWATAGFLFSIYDYASDTHATRDHVISITGDRREEVDADIRKSKIEALLFDDLALAKGLIAGWVRVELVGEESGEAGKHLRIKLSRDDWPRSRVWIVDPVTFRLVAYEHVGGDGQTLRTTVSDWKSFPPGVQVPTRIEETNDSGQRVTLELTSFELGFYDTNPASR